jgi:hypothetical protein
VYLAFNGLFIKLDPLYGDREEKIFYYTLCIIIVIKSIPQQYDKENYQEDQLKI